MYSNEQAMEAILALINGEWNNEQLSKLPTSLTTDKLSDIATILEYTGRFWVTNIEL